MTSKKTDRVLCQHVQGFAEGGECFPVDGVCVAGGVDVRTGFVDFGVDGEGGGVDGFVALDDGAGFVHQDQVGDADQGEVHGEGVEP